MNQLTDDSLPLIEVESDLDQPGHDRQRARVVSVPSLRVLAWWWVGAATVARLLCVARLPLGNGEAYYYSWSRFLDWSYYDHPPLVAWMVRVTTLFGSLQAPAAVHLGPVVASAAFGLLFHLGIWFNNPKTPFKLGCEPGATKPVVTPFNGTHNAGILVLGTAQFPANAGPLSHVAR